MPIASATLEAIRQESPLLFEVVQKLLQDLPDPRALSGSGQVVMASARLTAPSPVVFVGGSAVINYITPLVPPGPVTLIALPGSTWTLAVTAAGNIGAALTPSVGFAHVLAFDAASRRFFPASGAIGPPGPGGSYAVIQKITTAASQATIDFSSIPGTYTDIEVRFSGRSNLVATGDEAVFLTVNGDTTAANYSASQYLIGQGATAPVGRVAASAAGLFILNIPALNSLANTSGDFVVKINNYRGTTLSKHMRAEGAYQTGVADNETIIEVSGMWFQTTAINRLTFSIATSFLNGSVATLYGIG